MGTCKRLRYRCSGLYDEISNMYLRLRRCFAAGAGSVLFILNTQNTNSNTKLKSSFEHALNVYYLQLKLIEGIRKDVCNWMDKCIKCSGWKQALKHNFVRETILTTKGWKIILTSAAATVKRLYPTESSEIDKQVENYLRKLPVQDFLKSKAYQWIQYVHSNAKLQDPSWFPHLAVEVAHKVFRSNSKKTLRKYLGDKRRINKLPLIDLGVVKDRLTHL